MQRAQIKLTSSFRYYDGEKFRQIYRNISPLLCDKMGVIEVKVHLRLLRVCEHIAKKENHSYMILGNLALTFGSMASVSLF